MFLSRPLRACVIGADRLGNIPSLLSHYDIKVTHHVTGREKCHQRKSPKIPSGTELLILLTDFLGHNVMNAFRAAAQREGIRVVACRRSVCALRQALEQGESPCHVVNRAICQACPNKTARR